MPDINPTSPPPGSAGVVWAGGSMAAPWANIPSSAVGQTEPAAQDRRFASLSSLPEAGRLRPKRDLSPVRQARAQERALAAAGLPPPTVMPVGPVSMPLQFPPPAMRQLGFNCPGCFSVLIIKDPSSYDGKPAPCPTCGSRILPPRCVPESPFSIVPQQNALAVPVRAGLLYHAAGHRR